MEEPLTIRETLQRRNLNPTSKMIDILEAIEQDEEKFDELLSENPHLEAAKLETLAQSRSLKHKLLKDLITAKQNEDEQLLALRRIESDRKSQEGAKIPILKHHERQQLPDGRWIVTRIENGIKEASEA